MINKLFTAAAFWAAFGLLSGVFYREFTKLNDFDGVTQLSVLHTHTLTLGAFFFLIALGLEKTFNISEHSQRPALYFIIWNAGLGLTATMFTVKGVMQVLGNEAANSPAISGMHGLGHILLAIAFVMFFLNLKTAVRETQM